MKTIENNQNLDSTNQKKPKEIAREHLKEISQQVKPLVKEGVYSTVNQAIIEEIYKDETNHEFKTLKQWDMEDHIVRKGEKGFPIWGQPKNIEPNLEKNDIDKENNKPFFPVAYLFSDGQVEPKNIEKHEIVAPIIEIEPTIEDFETIREQASEPEISNDLER